MKLNVKRFIFWGVFCFLAGLTVFFRFPFQLQSSLNDLFAVQINGVAIPKEITNKYANVLNIVVEDDSFEKAKETADAFYEKLNSAGVDNITYKVQENILKQAVDYLKIHKNSFLSDKTRALLLKGQTAQVRENAITQIETSWMPSVIPLKEDAFLLLSDYVQNLDKQLSAWREKDGVLWQEQDGKNFILIFVNLNQDNAAKMVKQIRLIQKMAGPKIHISGAPVHTAQMFEQTKLDISIISALAFIMLFALTFGLFHNIRSALFVIFNLIVAFLCGTLSVFLFSPSVHFLTFAFGASLVGICIDYSFHRFYAQKDPFLLFKNIFYSFLTTVCCFGVLLFSDFSLLNQIALFTIGGLCGTFLWIFICPTIQSKPKSFKMFKIPFAMLFMAILLSLCVIGLGKVRIDHSPQNLYKPSPELQKEEAFFLSLNKNAFSYLLLTRGDNIQSLLEQEEKIKNGTPFFSLSTLLPSQKRQQENARLINALYEKEAQTLQADLELKQTPKFEQTPIVSVSDFKEKFPYLMQQFIVYTPENVWSVAPLSTTPNVSDKNVFAFRPAKHLSEQLDLYATKSYQNLFISLCVLFILLCFIYKTKAVKYLLPSLLGSIGTLGLLSYFEQPITFFHFLSLFVVVGLSMDYTIFLFNKKDIYFKPVLFSFLSSFIGFGLLSFVHFSMIAIIGQTIALGLFLSFCITLMMRK